MFKEAFPCVVVQNIDERTEPNITKELDSGKKIQYVQPMKHARNKQNG